MLEIRKFFTSTIIQSSTLKTRGLWATSLTWVALANIERFCSNTKYVFHFHLPHPTLKRAIILTNLPLFFVRMLSCLFVCFESHEQFFSYLATVTITGDRAANLDLCLTLTAFSSEGSFACHTYCDPWFYLLNAVLLAKEQSLPILNVLGLMRPAWAGLEITTYRLLSESTTTRLPQPCKMQLFRLHSF
jgi:hypothetical protein